MMEYASEIVNLGFAVFVAAYLLIRLDKTLKELTSAIQSFRDVQDQLDNLERELAKVKKRNEPGD